MSIIKVDYGSISGRQYIADTSTSGLSHSVPAGCTEGYLILAVYSNVFTAVPRVTITGCDAELFTEGGSIPGIAPKYWIYKIKNITGNNITVSFDNGQNTYLYTWMQIIY